MRRLFMQDTESPRTLGQLAVLAVGVIVSLVIVDFAVGQIMPRITIEPPFILRFQNVQGVEKLWSFDEAGIQPIVFTGSSQLHMGISPHVFNDRVEAITGQQVNSVNVSLFGSVAAIQRKLIQNLIIPNHPKLIFYGIEMRALLPAAQAAWMVDFTNRSLGYALSTSSAAERELQVWLLRHSNLFRYRDNFNEWLTAKRALNTLGYAPNTVDDLGHFKDPAIGPRDPISIKGPFVPFATNDVTNQIISDIGNECRQSGVQCILLNMPLHAMAYDYISDADEAMYKTVLNEAGLSIWDFNTEACRNVLGDESFYNLNHLNAGGATLFSQMVADVYANVFDDVPVNGDAACAVISP